MAAANQNSRRPRLQFRLWTLLLLVFLAAIASVPLAHWWRRPIGPLAVTLLADGSLLIDGKSIAPPTAQDALEKQLRQLYRYGEPITLTVKADPKVSSDRIMELIEVSRAAGFTHFTLQVSDARQFKILDAAASSLK